ncbi:MAG: hypothetical protein QOI04_2149 [Verrucomicrobiota bacterium]|jgi:hypothetical protein
MKTKLLYPLIALLIGLLAIEFSCFIFFSVFRDRFGFRNINAHTISRSDIPKLKEQYDFSLGWKKHYATSFGERPRRIEYRRPLLAVFGSSYTYCDQVNDADTWEEQLAAILAGDVYNFGVDAYGTDQAYLRFKEDAAKVSTPIVLLGVSTENINQIVNRYRPFYSEHTGHSLTKPRFILRNGVRDLLENPIRNANEIEKLLDPKFVESLGENDWWFRRDTQPLLGFPYTAILFQKRFWLEAFRHKGGHRVDDFNPRPWANLWTYPPARDLMFSFFDSFVAECKAADRAPVIVLLPSHTEVLAEMDGRHPKKIAVALAYAHAHGYACFDGTSAFAKNSRTKEDVNKFFQRHFTPLGNKMIASELAGFLTEQKLIEDPTKK